MVALHPCTVVAVADQVAHDAHGEHSPGRSVATFTRWDSVTTPCLPCETCFDLPDTGPASATAEQVAAVEADRLLVDAARLAGRAGLEPPVLALFARLVAGRAEPCRPVPHLGAPHLAALDAGWSAQEVSSIHRALLCLPAVMPPTGSRRHRRVP